MHLAKSCVEMWVAEGMAAACQQRLLLISIIGLCFDWRSARVHNTELENGSASSETVLSAWRRQRATEHRASKAIMGNIFAEHLSSEIELAKKGLTKRARKRGTWCGVSCRKLSLIQMKPLVCG